MQIQLPAPIFLSFKKNGGGPETLAITFLDQYDTTASTQHFLLIPSSSQQQQQQQKQE